MAFSDIYYFSISLSIVFEMECAFSKESWRLMSAILALKTLRQKEHHESEPSLGCILSLGKHRPHYETMSQNSKGSI